MFGIRKECYFDRSGIEFAMFIIMGTWPMSARYICTRTKCYYKPCDKTNKNGMCAQQRLRSCHFVAFVVLWLILYDKKKTLK